MNRWTVRDRQCTFVVKSIISKQPVVTAVAQRVFPGARFGINRNNPVPLDKILWANDFEEWHDE